MAPEARGRIGLLRRFLEQRHAGSTPRWAEAVSRCLTIDDLRQLMERRVPPVVTDYFLGGAGSEQTMRDNVEAFARARFNPRYGVKHAEIDLTTTVLGHRISMPVIAAPTVSGSSFASGAARGFCCSGRGASTRIRPIRSTA